jgi:hypothetical protein
MVEIIDGVEETPKARRERLQGLRLLRPAMYARLVQTGRVVEDEEIEDEPTD